MYGTLVRVRPARGKERELRTLIEDMDAQAGATEGLVVRYVLAPDEDPGELIALIVFSSADAYRRNAASPEQHREYEAMRALLEADPVWLDGEIVALEPETVSL